MPDGKGFLAVEDDYYKDKGSVDEDKIDNDGDGDYEDV